MNGRKKDIKGNVYFVRDGIGNVKIGVAYNVAKRVKQLQIGNANKLEVLFVMSVPNFEDAEHIEKELHCLFSKNRLHGEWFSEKNIVDYLAQDKIETKEFSFDGLKTLEKGR